MAPISKPESLRLEKMSVYENRLKSQGFQYIAGVDEAGRGPLAGPVVAAACIMPENISFSGLNDSKQLTAEKREDLYAEITSCPNLYYGIGIIDVEAIDRVNILQATFLAMRDAIAKLKIAPDYLLIDGSQVPTFEVPVMPIVQGDSLSISIAAASILAKVTRDRIMCELDDKFPDYGFKKHKGYATEQHIQAIEIFGPSPIHRKSFDPVKTILNPIPVQYDLFY